MTVAELIEKLKNMPTDAEIELCACDAPPSADPMLGGIALSGDRVVLFERGLEPSP